MIDVITFILMTRALAENNMRNERAHSNLRTNTQNHFSFQPWSISPAAQQKANHSSWDFISHNATTDYMHLPAEGPAQRAPMIDDITPVGSPPLPLFL